MAKVETVSFVYDIGEPIDLAKVKRAAPYLNQVGGDVNFLYAKFDALNVVLFKDGRVRVTHEAGTQDALQKALPTGVAKIRKVVEDAIKACGIRAAPDDVISAGRQEDAVSEALSRPSLGDDVSVMALRELAVFAPRAVLGEYQAERVATQAGESLGRRLADGVKDKKALGEKIVSFLKEEGLGIAEVGRGKDGEVFTVMESALSYALPPTGKPACGLIRGIIRGAYAAFLKQESVSVTETKCWGKGDTACEFSVKQLSM